jgi:ABC-type hemin transport system ATPase subunit
MAKAKPDNQAVDQLPDNVFEERAENLSKKELFEWSADMPHDREVIDKLKSGGATLLSGPRGSGKSTLLKRAYFELLETKVALPVYVNYAKSLALEPLFHKRADALQLFRQWLVAKIVDGVAVTIEDAGINVDDGFLRVSTWARSLIHSFEVGDAPEVIEDAVSPTQLVDLLEGWTASCKRKRCVLLLDDAAHAFSSEQQREFFEVFRLLKSAKIAAKAAVYPGVTSYSPNFHIGHEAKLLEVWCKPEGEGYLKLMRNLFERRFGTEIVAKRLSGKEALLDYLALASFGLPRAYLTMVSELLGVDEAGSVNPTKAGADRAISNLAASTRAVFESLAQKLPRLENFILLGSELERAITQLLRQYNIFKLGSSKAVLVAIAEPPKEFTKILALMEYAGLIRNAGTLSKGPKGVYHRYTLHYAIILSENALSLGKAPSVEGSISVLTERDAHAVPRTRSASLLGENYESRCTLNLTPCPSCGTPRVTERARYCGQCGAALSEASIYTELLKAPIQNLPLTNHKIEGLLTETSIQIVQDIMLDEESKQIRSVKGIGPIWAKRIHTAAEEYVTV